VHNGGEEDDNIYLSEVKFTLDFVKENKRFRLFLSLYLSTFLMLPRSSNQQKNRMIQLQKCTFQTMFISDIYREKYFYDGRPWAMGQELKLMGAHRKKQLAQASPAHGYSKK
jgi:hypothetical protein